MKSITKIEDCYLLPEKPQLVIKEETLPDRTILHIPYFRDIVAVELEDYTISLFLDKDGRWMTIGYDSEGAYKMPVHLSIGEQ